MKENLDNEIMAFFRDIENQTESDKIRTLRLLLDKHLHISKADYLMDKFDFSAIVGSAKREIVNKTLPVRMGKTDLQIMENEVANLCVIEATILHLNKNGCLKKIPKFDYNK
jgi:hypothetical protein